MNGPANLAGHVARGGVHTRRVSSRRRLLVKARSLSVLFPCLFELKCKAGTPVQIHFSSGGPCSALQGLIVLFYTEAHIISDSAPLTYWIKASIRKSHQTNLDDVGHMHSLMQTFDTQVDRCTHTGTHAHKHARTQTMVGKKLVLTRAFYASML